MKPLHLLALCLVLANAGAGAQSASLLAPLFGVKPELSPQWRTAGLPDQTLPRTVFSSVSLDGHSVLRVEALASYGNLAHEVPPASSAATLWLSWRWRVDQFVAGSDLRHKSTDDNAVKVCAMFDLALARLPFAERWRLRVARSRSAEPLPAATVCYVWDRLLPAFTALPNAYTRRMRYMVLQGPPLELSQWRSERRDLTADFLRLFGDEATEIPPLVSILVGADADNTRGHGLAYVADLVLERSLGDGPRHP